MYWNKAKKNKNIFNDYWIFYLFCIAYDFQIAQVHEFNRIENEIAHRQNEDYKKSLSKVF